MHEFCAEVLRDLRFALRQTLQRPGLVLASVVMLGLGIGGSTAAFSALYQVLLKPLPYPDPDNLLFIHNRFPKSQVATTGVSAFDYAEVKRHYDVFSQAAVFYWNDLIMTGVGEARHLNVVNSSASLFDTLGVAPQIGRPFTPAEDVRGAPGRAILSDALWRSTFGGDRNVLGRVVLLNGVPFTVVGVMPASFQFPSRETEMWIPVALPPNAFTLEGGRIEKWLHMVARLAAGVTFAKAEAGLKTIGDAVAARYPAFYPVAEGWGLSARQLADEQTERVRRWLYLAFGAVVALLLIACINVSGLLLVRETARSGEIAVRRAMGASRFRIMRQMLTETGLVAVAGCFVGMVVTGCGLRLVNLYGPLTQPILLQEAGLAFALGVTLISTVSAGILPAMLAANLSLEQRLKRGASRMASRGAVLRNGIVAAQIACAVALIFVATQLNRSFLNLTHVPVGFDAQNVWSGAITLPSHAYVAPQSWNSEFYESLLKKLESLPGVEAASGGNALPFNPSGVWTEAFRLPGRAQEKSRPEAQISVVFPRYFETMRIPLLKGRTFSDADRSGAAPVTVVDTELARRYFADEDPIGKLIAVGGEETPARIIGVVGGVHNSDLGGPALPELYFPEYEERVDATYLVLRMMGSGDPAAGVRRAIATLNPGVALYDAQFMKVRIADSLKLRSFVGFLIDALAGASLLLAVMGLCGTLSHLVELQQHEIGIRMALGARQGQVVATIMRRAGIIVLFGVGFGALAAAFAEGILSAQFFGVGLAEAPVWMIVLGAMLFVSLLFALIPARRAAAVEPSVALRSE